MKRLTQTSTDSKFTFWSKLCPRLPKLGIAIGALGLLPFGCIPDGPPPGELRPSCGGIAGIPCPGSGECVDDPGDDCDPTQGGADCGGLCECNVLGLCSEGERWDSSATVCGCVPDYNPCIAALCPEGTNCIDDDGEAVCVPIDGADPGSDGEACGETTCGSGLVCCNVSCGICTPPDGVCIQLACE